MLGLYLHIPFCSHICNYCNFNRGLFDAAVKAQYVDALATEIRRAGDGSAADTIFFGGGTPSLLEPDDVARLIEACREAFAVAGDAEVTLETNPETVTVERMRAFRAAGVNRVSLGVQSLHDAELARLGRQHGAARARSAVADIRAAGVDNLSLDLMLWLPQQTPDDWSATVEGLIALDPDHASLYLLELYPNAPLREEMARAQWSLAPDDDAADMYLWGIGRLDEAGYGQYEISNVAKPGRQSRHNLKYWERRRLAGLRLRRAFDARRLALEERRRDRRLHRQDRRRRRGGRGPARAAAGGAGGRRAFHRHAPDLWNRFPAGRRALRGGSLGSLRARARTAGRGRASHDRGPSRAADTPRNAGGERRDGALRLKCIAVGGYARVGVSRRRELDDWI